VSPANRHEDLDRAKAVAILLVVFGHIVARDPPTGNNWYVLLKFGIYQFHMPFFMYLSGYVTFLSGAARLAPHEWPRLVSRRVARLLLPFLIFGLAIIAGKLVLGSVLYIDNPVASVGPALVNLFWHTDDSAAHSVWYVAVLFIECIVTPPLLYLLRGRTSLLLLVAAVIYFLPIPHRVYLDEFAEFYLFFVLGGVAAEAGDGWLRRVDAYAWAWLGGLGAALAFTFWALATGWIHIDDPRQTATMLICGVASMPAVHALVRRRPLSRSALLLSLAYYTFVIYLLNTPWIGLVKAVALKVMPWDGVNFLLFAPLLMLAGVFGPILTKQLILRRVPVLDRMTQ